MWFLVIILTPSPKILSRSFAKNLFSRKQRKGEWARDVTNRGGVCLFPLRGGIPPGIHTYHHTSKSPRSCFHKSIYFTQLSLHNPVLEDKHTLFRAREVDLRDKLCVYFTFLHPLFPKYAILFLVAFPHKPPCNFTRTQNITSYLGFKGQIVS